MRCKLHNKRRGFSLVELAIVFGIIGVVSAAIWAAASKVSENAAIDDTVQAITDISTRVRSLYTGFPNATAPASVAEEITRGLYPESVVNGAGTATINRWGGTYDIVFDGASVGSGFSIEIALPASVPVSERRAACLGLINSFPGSATSYAGTFSGTLPNAPVAFEPAQGSGAAFNFIRIGTLWRHTTNDTVADIMTAMNVNVGCTGAAFYFKM